MKNAILGISIIVALALAAAIPAFAEGTETFSLTSGMDYNTGKYGGTQSTQIRYIPVTGKYQRDGWTFKLTVPYLQISGPRNVINGVGAVTTTTTTVSTRSGLGDVIASASNMVYNGGNSGILVAVTGKVKFGTASRSAGLGTGENDYALQGELYKLSGKLTSFGTLGYKIYGSPTGYTLNNIVYGSLGGSYKLDQKTSGGMVVTFGQRTTPTGSSRLQAILFSTLKLDKEWKAQGYLLKGFTRSVPDRGIGVSLAYAF